MYNVSEEYTEMVRDLAKPGKVIKDECDNEEVAEIYHASLLSYLATKLLQTNPLTTNEDFHVWHMTVGILTEVGELLDTLKRITIYRVSPESPKYNKLIENIEEELGDLLFYTTGLTVLDSSNKMPSPMMVAVQAQLGTVISVLGHDINQLQESNMKKLLKGERARYKSGSYSDDEATRRDDKDGGAHV